MTTTALHPQPHHQPYPRLSHSISDPRRSYLTLNETSTLAYHKYPAADSPSDSNPPPLDPPKNRAGATAVAASVNSPAMSSRLDKRPDWNKFYENGIPKEVIVIDDSSPEPTAIRKVSGDYTKRSAHHPDKRRRIDAAYDPVHSSRDAAAEAGRQEPSSADTASSANDRTTSALYSTAPTSLTSTGSDNHTLQPLENTRAGQKRKRTSRKAFDEESPEPEPTTQTHNWSNYVPPPKPPLKSKEVYVNVVRDVRVTYSSTMPLQWR